MLRERYSYTAGIAAPCILGRSFFGSIVVIGPVERIAAFGVEKAGSIVRGISNQLSGSFGDSYKSAMNDEPRSFETAI